MIFEITITASHVIRQSLHAPVDHTVLIIAEWMTAKKERDEMPSPSSFIRY